MMTILPKRRGYAAGFAVREPHFSELLEQFLTYLDSGHHAQSTLVRDHSGVQEFLWFLEKNKVACIGSVTYQTMLQFVAYLKNRRKLRRPDECLSIYQQIRLLNGVRSFFRFLVKSGTIEHNPAADVVIKRPKHLPRNIMNPQEITAILNAEDTETLPGVRNRVILELLYGTGLRRSEVINLEVRDVELVEGVLCIREGKGKKDRYVPMSPTLHRWMERYLKEVRPEYLLRGRCYKRHNQRINHVGFIRPFNPNALFLNYRGEALTGESVRKVVRDSYERAKRRVPGLAHKHITPHCFRHTIATHLVKKGVDIRKIQKFLGHASLESTEIYTHVDIEDLKEIARNHHPREHSEGIRMAEYYTPKREAHM